MDKQKFIEKYQAKITRYNLQNKHYIKDNSICNVYLETEYKIKIDDCLAIIDLYNQAKEYLHGLKPGDKAISSKYFSKDNIEILKVNYKKGLSKKGNKIISSFGIKILFDNGNTCKTQAKPLDLNFKGISIRKLIDCYYHVTGYFLSFCKYDVLDVKEVLEGIISWLEPTIIIKILT